MSWLIDRLLRWCDKQGNATYGEYVERGCIALLYLSGIVGLSAGVLLGRMVGL